ncbi:MAG: (2Fe-2S)-binding protein [Anaerolineales bacterium]
MICRCEGVRKKEIRDSIDDFAKDLFGIKLRTRLGMGQCQGRYCFSNAAMLIQLCTGRNVSDLELPTVRPPITPVRLRQLAAYRQSQIENEEVS